MAETSKTKPQLVDDATGGQTLPGIGLAMAVHTDLGPGHRESTYHNAMTQLPADAGLDTEREPELPIYDENGNQINSYRPNHPVGPNLLVEYKAHRFPLTNDEIAQCLDYFAGSDCNVLLLLNFGRRRLEWQRFFPPKDIQEHRRQTGSTNQTE